MASCVAALAVPIAIRAQPPQVAPKFDVASIKRNAGGGPSNSVEIGLMRAIARASRGGRFHVPNASLHLLIQLAYDARDYQIVGEPSWAASDGYAVTAKAEGDVNFEQMRPMLQSLLADRFQFSFHRETRQLPVYELAAAKGGLRIAPAKAGSCVTRDPQGPTLPFGSKICGGERIGIGRIEGFGVTMPKLVELLSDRIGRTVIDRTSFRGAFDFQLDFAPEEAMGSDPGTAPSIFAALQEQLGMRLESAKGPVEVLVIDRVERPAEN